MLKFDNYFNVKWLVIAVVFTAIVLLLTHIPKEAMPPRLQENNHDKLHHVMAYGHVVAYGVITLLFILSLKASSTPFLLFLLFYAILVIGIVDEATQPLVNRTASLADIVANFIGIATVLFLSIVGKRRFQKTKTE